MSVKISRITFKQLRNSEFTLFVGQVVIITQKHEPDALNLTKSFNNVLSLMADLSKIKAKELSSKLSPVLHELDAERDSLSTGIIAIIKAVGLMKKSPFASQVLVLNHFFDTQGAILPMIITIRKPNVSTIFLRLLIQNQKYKQLPQP